MSTVTHLITAEEYARMPESDRPTELVRGEIVEINVSTPRHGYICGHVAALLWNFVSEHTLGRVFTNDSGAITGRDPDTVRGPDVWYVSYQKLPPGPLPDKYLDVIPDLAFEVLSPDDRWGNVLNKVAEYLSLGVPAVCVLNPDDKTVQLFFRDQPKSRTLSAEEELSFPDILPGFSLRVGQLFE